MTTLEYRIWMGYECANPDCDGRTTIIETHHILKRRLKGPNKAWNYICLCKKCHARHENDPDSHKLFFWKSHLELRKFGFFLDEHDASFEQRAYENLKLRKSKPAAKAPPTFVRGEKFEPVRSYQTETPIKEIYKPNQIKKRLMRFSQKMEQKAPNQKINFDKVKNWIDAHDHKQAGIKPSL